MKIEIIKCLQDNYSYLIIDETNNTACVIDPSEAKPILKFLENNKIVLRYILNTHHHYDHVGGNKKLKEKYNCKIIGFEKDKNRIPEIDVTLKDKQKWKCDLFECTILHIPGHTSGHICIYINKLNALFTGDTLFSLGCGRVFEGTHRDMFNSLNKLKILPPETKVYCGHEYTKSNLDFCLKYDPDNSALKKKLVEINLKLKNNLPTVPTSIGEELNTNIFLRCDNEELKDFFNMKGSSDLNVFTKLRDLKDTF